MKKIWKYLSGKKRNIALFYWGVTIPAIAILWPQGAPEALEKTNAIIGLMLSYLGLGHAMAKKLS